MTHSTRKPVFLLTSRHQLTQVTSWSAFLAALEAAHTARGSPLTRTYSSLPWSQWNSSCLNYSQGDVENFLSSPPFSFHHWLLLLCFSLADFQPSTLLLFHPWHQQAGMTQALRILLTAHGIFKQPTCKLWVSFFIWISLFMVFKELGVTFANSSLRVEGTPLKGNQLGDL